MLWDSWTAWDIGGAVDQWGQVGLAELGSLCLIHTTGAGEAEGVSDHTWAAQLPFYLGRTVTLFFLA